MRVVVQRVASASVIVKKHTVGAIDAGLLVLLGVSLTDTADDADYLLDKVLWLRIFTDEDGKMNRNVRESGGALLVVSQFTLYGDCRKGRRPSFDQAARPEQARALYEHFVDGARRSGTPVQTGEFQAMMEVHLINDGPVTILIDSADRKRT